MNDTWLEADGRRTEMRRRRSDGFATQLAIDGDDYEAGLFLCGEPSQTHDKVMGFESDAKDRLFVLWSSGTHQSIGIMAGGVIRAIQRKNCLYFHWRNGSDETIQTGTFPLIID